MKKALMKNALTGNVSGISGDMAGLSGDVTGLSGDVDDCEITDEERKAGVNVSDLIRKEG